MELKLISIILFIIQTVNSENVTSQQRAPRVSGRIVKLYTRGRSSGFQCEGEGFHQDDLDCSTFYRCVEGGSGKFITFRFQCGPGTVYDPNTNVCNHPASTLRKECGGILKSVPSTDSGARNFHRHEQSAPKPFSTRKANSDDTTRRPSYSENNNYDVENEIDQSPSYEGNNQQQTTTQAATTTTKQTTKQTTTNHQSTTKNRPSGDDKCSSDGFMGDSKDCRKFYRCVANGRGGFIRYEFSCSESTVWDQEIQACNHPWAAKSQRCSRGEMSNEIDYKPNNQDGAKSNEKRTNQSQNQVNYGSHSSQSQNQINYGSNVNQQQNQTNYGDRVNQTQNQINYGDAVSQSQIQANYGSQSTQSQTQINHNTQSSQTQTQTISQPATNEDNAQHDEYIETTTRRNNKGNQCSSSGFMGDNDDCRKFYRCVDNGRGSYTRFEFSCGEGTVWDPEIEACNHAWAVKKCGGNRPQDINKIETETSSQSKPTPAQTTEESNDYDQGYGQQQEQTTHTTTTTTTRPKQTHIPPSNDVCRSDGFIGDTQDCKKFYRCVDNGRGGFIKYEFSCGQGTVWDQEIQGCNHESQGKCGSSYSTEENQPSTSAPLQDEMPTEHTHKVQQSTEQQQQSTTQREMQPSSNKKCTGEGFVGDDEDCRKFYRCVDNGRGGYTKYEFTCGEGTQWDQEIQGCNHETKDCRRTQTPSQSSSARPSETTTRREWEQETTSKESTTQVQSKPTSSDQCTSEGFFGDSSDCKKFHRCVDNGQGGYIKYEFTCGEGTVWDQEIQGCNHESDVSNCGASSSQTTRVPEPQRTTTNKPGSQTTNRVDDEYPSQEETTRRPASSSSGTCDSEGFFANEEDCKKFYRCVDNGKGGYTRYDFVCGEGTAWDQKIQGCNHENQVECESGSNHQTQSTKPQQSTTQAPPPSNDEQQKEPNTDEKPCDDDKQNDQSHESTTSNSGKCESEGYYGDPEDCKKFYRCVDNGKGGFTKYDFTCGEGTIWDQDITTCNHPQDVSNPSCKNSDSSINTESTTKKQESTGQNKPCSQSTTTQGNSCGSQSSTEASSSEPESTTKRRNDNVTCPHAGFYANPNDCKKFYRCVDWDGNGKKYSVFHFDCGEGTIWDPELETCNYEESVYPPRDCSGSYQQAGTTEESDTTSQKESTTSESTSTTTAKSTTSTTKKSTTKSSTTTTTTEKQTTSDENTTEKSTSEQTTQQTTSEKTTEKQTEGTTEGTTEKQSESTTQGSTTSEQTTEGTTEQTTEQTEESTTESSSSSNKTCPETDDDQYLYVCPTGFRRHPKYCNLFYQCTENDDNHDVKVAVFHCPNNTIYDESKTQCLEESETDQKCDGEIAESRRFRRLDDNSNPPLTVHRQRLLCPSEGHFAFDKSDQCSPAFLKCRRSDSSLRMRGYIYQCPENYVYWAVSRRCERASRMKGCTGADKTWIRRWEIPVEMLNIAV